MGVAHRPRRHRRCNRLHRKSRWVAVPTLGSILDCADSVNPQYSRAQGPSEPPNCSRREPAPGTVSRAGRLPRQKGRDGSGCLRKGKARAAKREWPQEALGASVTGIVNGSATIDRQAIQRAEERPLHPAGLPGPPHDHRPDIGDRSGKHHAPPPPRRAPRSRRPLRPRGHRRTQHQFLRPWLPPPPRDSPRGSRPGSGPRAGEFS